MLTNLAIEKGTHLLEKSHSFGKVSGDTFNCNCHWFFNQEAMVPSKCRSIPSENIWQWVTHLLR